ncbi:50S ribosomal protein L21 [Alkalidesulfovibrio alkalitolerans DSM 16529]|jgi:large subunit ribosomal protein L21|uniref:Large ribosomal subunit protein bL21 n=1 Tax=Alkalidesulfovibrio alkalitolerans DSM 16529 TaxID=1121439 RepID=S7USY6_9BACT|nr:50S ribosomal protein L21 [Alkalidesulfovibrio alkalitolerans]EPR35418.1 50S ribosomal protein L21 [Alkalidesulfovibrio alkalitolerans DSM 16529]
MFAIIETGGKQYRVQEGWRFNVERLDAAAGSEFVLDKVLLVNNGGTIAVGSPYLDGGKVTCEVLAHGRDKKVVVFKKRRRKDSAVKRGHRQEFTTLKVKAISA